MNAWRKRIRDFLSREVTICTLRTQIDIPGHAIVPNEPTDLMIDAGLATTNGYLNIAGSALTVNREKMRRRYKAMIEVGRVDTDYDPSRDM